MMIYTCVSSDVTVSKSSHDGAGPVVEWPKCQYKEIIPISSDHTTKQSINFGDQ